MKIHHALTAFFLVLVVANCTKKDDPTPSTGLVGSWDLTSTVLSDCTDPAMDGSDPCVSCKILTFNADGTYIESDGTGGFPGTYSVSGGSLTFDDVSSGPTETYPFTVTATTLTLVVSDYDCKVEEVYTRK